MAAEKFSLKHPWRQDIGLAVPLVLAREGGKLNKMLGSCTAGFPIAVVERIVE